MPDIINKNPIESTTFDKLWIRQMHFKNTDNGVIFKAQLVPYDGEHTLSEPITNIVKHDNSSLAVFGPLETEVKKLNGNRDLLSINIFAEAPSKPVVLVAIPKVRDNPNDYVMMRDLFGAIGENDGFATLYVSLIQWINSLV